jgi:hypothetical protein
MAGGNRPAPGGRSRSQPRAAASRPQPRAATPRPQPRAAASRPQASAPRPQRPAASQNRMTSVSGGLGSFGAALPQQTGRPQADQTKARQAKGKSLKRLQQPSGDMARSIAKGPITKPKDRPKVAAAAQPAQNLSWQSSEIGKYATGGEVYGGSLGPGVFDAASWMRARNVGGFSDEQIKDYLAKGDTGLYIGNRPQAVIDNWATENPKQYTQYVDPTGENKFEPARVLFNPLGSTNLGIGRGGLQDKGISWYTSSNLPSNNQTGEMNVLENSYFMNTPEGMSRVFEGESPVPTRFMGDPKTGQPSSAPGSIPFGYDQFTSPAAKKYLESLQYKGSWLK